MFARTPFGAPRRFLAAALLAAGLFSVRATRAQTSVLTYHNDNGRTGQNLQETVLTPANVNPSSFGKLFSIPVDGQVYAQPLYVPSVAVPGNGVHNAVFVATENDTVYAFDADSKSAPAGETLWTRSFVNGADVVPVPYSEVGKGGGLIRPKIGITGTPVIDAATGTLYCVAYTRETATGGAVSYVHRLHALDIATGNEKFGGPVVIAGSVAGAGYHGLSGQQDAVNGQVVFNSQKHLQRPALLLSHGAVYIGFGSHEDQDPYHGWLFAYDAATLQQKGVFNVSPNGGLGGLWQTGCGPAADDQGRIFFISSNGSFDPSQGNYSQCFLRMGLSGAGLSVQDYFAPHDEASLSSVDLDLGSGGHILLPDQPGPRPHLMAGAGKNGTIYMVDRDAMGHFNAADDSQIVSVDAGAIGQSFASPAYFNGRLYYAGLGDALKAFPVTNGVLAATPAATAPDTYNYPGATPVVTANGTANAIVWLSEDTQNGVLATLHAYSAAELTPLYDSNAAGTRDHPGANIKFAVPTVANGKVYLGTASNVTVFGLLQNAPPAPPDLDTVTALNATTIRAVYTRAVSSAAGSVANYALDNGGVLTAAALAADGKTVTLTANTLTPTLTYTLTVNNVADLSTPPIPVAANTAKTFIYTPPTAFGVDSVTAESNTTVAVLFNSLVDPGTAANPANYTLDQGISISGAAFGTGGKTIRLTTAPLAPGYVYTVTVNNVTDLSSPARTVAPNTTRRFTYAAPAAQFGLISVTALDAAHVKAIFNRPADAASGAAAANYAVLDTATRAPVNVNSAGLSPDGATVTLATDALAYDARTTCW